MIIAAPGDFITTEISTCVPCQAVVCELSRNRRWSPALAFARVRTFAIIGAVDQSEAYEGKEIESDYDQVH